MIVALRRRDAAAAGDESWTSVVAESTAQQWTVVHDLESGVVYEIKVIADGVDGAYCPETQSRARRVHIDGKTGSQTVTFYIAQQTCN